MSRERGVLATLLILAAYVVARPPRADGGQLTAASERFRFSKVPLDALPATHERSTAGATAAEEAHGVRGPSDRALRVQRPVHPALEPLARWISAFGAGAALADLDGDGLSNELCLVDPRDDSVRIRTLSAGRAPEVLLVPTGGDWDARTMAPMGCLTADFSEDGLVDVLVYYWGRPPVLFIRRSGTREIAFEQGAPVVDDNEAWNSNAAVATDLDGDGHLDLVVGNYFADGVALLDASATSGRPQMPTSMSRASNGGSTRFLRFTGMVEGRPRFEDLRGVLRGTLATGWTLALGAQDLDGDLLPELYIANDFGPDVLLRNHSRPGQVTLEPVYGRRSPWRPGSRTIGQDSYKGMGVDFGDIDGDGRTDIWVSNISAQYALFEAHSAWIRTSAEWDGGDSFEDRSEALGLARSDWAWDGKLADFDNDGQVEAIQGTGFFAGSVDRWPELQELATANDRLLEDPAWWPRFGPRDALSGDGRVFFFVRLGERFFDISRLVGLGDEQISRGIAIGDVDGDSDLDLVVANQWAESALYTNDGPWAARGLTLRLLLAAEPSGDAIARVDAAHPGSPAIGARVRVRTASGRSAQAEVDGGNGHAGRRAPEVHFGLGADRAASVEVAWRDRTGALQEQRLQLPPGRHTLLLGASKAGP